MKPTKELTPTASAKLDNYITMTFEDVNEMTDTEQTALEMLNAGITSEFELQDMNEAEWKLVCEKSDEYEAYDQWMGE
jgi:hypothetical protein